MERPDEPNESFGPRLAALRKSRGLTQIELAERLGVSQRVITYYENESPRPPTQYLPQLASALEVTIGELFGTAGTTPIDRALLLRLEKIQQLPESDQNAIIKMIDGLAGNGPG